MKPIPPCKNCKKRTLGCHAECPDYIDFKNKNIEYNRVIAQARFEDNALNEIKWLPHKEYKK